MAITKNPVFRGTTLLVAVFKLIWGSVTLKLVYDEFTLK
jgi:hypothetical protein